MAVKPTLPPFTSVPKFFFFFTFLAELGDLASFMTMSFFSKINKDFFLKSPPAGLVIRGNFFEKYNKVSNDSK